MAQSYSPVADVVWHPASRAQAVARAGAVILLGSLLLAVSARTQLPLGPVPFTMQTSVVLGFGFAFGPRLAVATVGAYLLQGALGLPVFAAGGGVFYLFASPTAGYLWGMLPAAAITGASALRGWDRSFFRALVAIVAATVVTFVCGVALLAVHVGLDSALLVGAAPFLVSETSKMLLLASALPVIRRGAQRLGGHPSS